MKKHTVMEYIICPWYQLNTDLWTGCRQSTKREQHTRRGRFTAPTADLSAFAGYSAIPINLLNRIIGPTPFLVCCVGETDKYQHRPW